VPQVLITTNEAGGSGTIEVHRERIVPADFETETASSLLIERIGWALNDAEALERPVTPK
jgi:hypothetical protein